jgi:hypothetical protein
MSNVIDIKDRLKQQNSKGKSKKADEGDVVDLAALRQETIRQDRRQVKRTILTEFIAVHVVVPEFGLLKVHLYDINEKGLSFDLDLGKGKFNASEEVEVRIYLNQFTYFKISALVAHVKTVEDEGVTRHGCTFVKESLNSEALHHFIKFLETVTASLKRDNGDILVSKINS